MVRPSKWPPEFRERAVALYRESEGRTIAEVALELGVGAETFRKWVRQDEADRGERSDRPCGGPELCTQPVTCRSSAAGGRHESLSRGLCKSFG